MSREMPCFCSRCTTKEEDKEEQWEELTDEEIDDDGEDPWEPANYDWEDQDSYDL